MDPVSRAPLPPAALSPSSPPAGGSLPYMVQLDGLRALAVLAVLIHHFLPRHTLIRQLVPWGTVGVYLFFVLSGFLITGILLRYRLVMEAGRQTLGQITQTFYMRRLLRILPIYYLTLTVAALINVPPIRETFFWHLFHVSNWYVVVQGEWLLSISHFWSLAMEEQFYLLFPWVVLGVPRRYLLPTIWGMVAIAPIARLGLAPVLNDAQLYTLPLSSLDALGLGALLAVYNTERARWGTLKTRLCGLALGLGLPLFVLLQAVSGWQSDAVGLSKTVEPTLIAWVCLGVVNQVAQGVPGVAGQLLAATPLVYMGKISYGIYLFHPFVHLILPVLSDRLSWPYPTDLFNQFLWQTLVTIFLAAASWHGFEQPLNTLKRHFVVG